MIEVCEHHQEYPQKIYNPCIGCELLRLHEAVRDRNEVLQRLGYCTECMTVPEHHVDEPFSTCKCGSGEDYAQRPLQKLQTYEKGMHK